MMTDRSDAIREMLDLAREIKEGGATNSSLKTKLSFFKTKVGLSDAVFDRIVDLIEKTDLPEEEKMQTFSISIWEYEKLENRRCRNKKIVRCPSIFRSNKLASDRVDSI